MDWSTFTVRCIIILLDYGLSEHKVIYTLVAADINSALAASQIIANRLKAITNLQIKSVGVTFSYTDLDVDQPLGDREDTAYLVGYLPDDQWYSTQVPGYNEPVLAGNILDLNSPDIQGYMNLFTSDMIVSIQGESLVDFCSGFMLNRGKVLR